MDPPPACPRPRPARHASLTKFICAPVFQPVCILITVQAAGPRKHRSYKKMLTPLKETELLFPVSVQVLAPRNPNPFHTSTRPDRTARPPALPRAPARPACPPGRPPPHKYKKDIIHKQIIVPKAQVVTFLSQAPSHPQRQNSRIY